MPEPCPLQSGLLQEVAQLLPSGLDWIEPLRGVLSGQILPLDSVQAPVHVLEHPRCWLVLNLQSGLCHDRFEHVDHGWLATIHRLHHRAMHRFASEFLQSGHQVRPISYYRF